MENFVTWYKFTFAVNAMLNLSKFNVSDFSTMFFFPTFYALKAWFGLSRVKLCRNKNRRKAIFNWAAKGLFFLRGGGGYTHSGYHKTLSATIACDRTSCETET